MAARTASMITLAEFGEFSAERLLRLNSQKAEFVVLQPRDTIVRTTIDVLRIELLPIHLAENRMRLARLFALQPRTVQHIEKIGIRPDVELV